MYQLQNVDNPSEFRARKPILGILVEQQPIEPDPWVQNPWRNILITSAITMIPTAIVSDTETAVLMGALNATTSYVYNLQSQQKDVEKESQAQNPEFMMGAINAAIAASYGIFMLDSTQLAAALGGIAFLAPYAYNQVNNLLGLQKPIKEAGDVVAAQHSADNPSAVRASRPDFKS